MHFMSLKMGSEFRYIGGANRVHVHGKYTFTLQSYISVTDNIQVDELNKLIATGLFYVHTEFDAFSTLVPGEMYNSNPLG